MNSARRPLLQLSSLLVAAVSLVGGSLAAQEPEREFDLPLLGESSPQEEMERLFHEVERTLVSIDIELADAGAGEIPLGEGRESGLERLLNSASKKGGEAVSGIDRILELAEKMGGSCSSCMKPSEKSGGESPLDKERDRGPQKGERTPESPKTSQEEPKPEPKPGESGQEDNRQPNQPQGENRPGSPRQDESAAGVARIDDAERWGSLPERVQQVFQNQLTDDLPLQYRDWIDSYYRRLNAGR